MGLIDNLINVNINAPNYIPPENPQPTASVSYGGVLIVGGAYGIGQADGSEFKGAQLFTNLAQVASFDWGYGAYGAQGNNYLAAKAAFENGAHSVIISPMRGGMRFQAGEPYLFGYQNAIAKYKNAFEIVVIAHPVNCTEVPNGVGMDGNTQDIINLQNATLSDEKLLVYSVGQNIDGTFQDIGITEPTENTVECLVFSLDTVRLAPAYVSFFSKYAPGSEQWAYKSLIGVDDISDGQYYTDDLITSLDTANINYYAGFAGRDLCLGGKTKTGEWIDIVRFSYYLKKRIQYAVTNVFQSNIKIAYTDTGLSIIRLVIESELRAAIEYGAIASIEYTKEGETILPYSIIVPKASDISTEDKTNRILTGVTFSAKLSGAIYRTVITGNLELQGGE